MAVGVGARILAQEPQLHDAPRPFGRLRISALRACGDGRLPRAFSAWTSASLRSRIPALSSLLHEAAM
jgi:hypothetical protein